MRKSQLRQQIDNHLRHDHSGSYRAKQHRYFVLHKIVRDLFHIECVPGGTWHALTFDHVQRLVAHWKTSKLKPSTIMKYMTVFRDFLQKINHTMHGIDNQSLGITNRRASLNSTHPPVDILTKFSNPIATLLFKFQVCFGLTLSEAMRLVPDMHIQKENVWVTRDIATNSQDRFVPIRHEEQSKIIDLFLTLCIKNKNLISTLGYHHVREAYRTQLKSLGLPSSKTYRYLYAKSLYQALSPILSNYQINQTIMREMGIQSRMTLWSYLNE